MDLNNLEFHELADVFPFVDEEQIQALARDIKAHGLIAPLTLYEGKILDGRNRYLACKQAQYKLQPHNVELFEDVHEGKDPILFVVSANIHRRHLTVGQRAALADELLKRVAKRPAHRPPKSGQQDSSEEESQKEKVSGQQDSYLEEESQKEKIERVAAAVGVGARTVEEYQHTKKEDTALAKQVVTGATTQKQATQKLRQARKAAKPEANEFEEALARIEKVCGKIFIDLIRDDQIPGLRTAALVVEYAKLREHEMVMLRGALYRSLMTLAEARKFYDRGTNNHGKWDVDWTWTLRELAALMMDENKYEISKTFPAPNGLVYNSMLKRFQEKAATQEDANNEKRADEN